MKPYWAAHARRRGGASRRSLSLWMRRSRVAARRARHNRMSVPLLLLLRRGRRRQKVQQAFCRGRIGLSSTRNSATGLAPVIARRAALTVGRGLLSEADADSLLVACRRTRPHTAVCCVRSLLNAWNISARRGEVVGHCLLRCGAEDARDHIQHYLIGCLPFAEDLAAAWGSRVAPAEGTDWGLSVADLRPLASAYTFYHGLARTERSRVGPRSLHDAALAARKAHSDA